MAEKSRRTGIIGLAGGVTITAIAIIAMQLFPTKNNEQEPSPELLRQPVKAAEIETPSPEVAPSALKISDEENIGSGGKTPPHTTQIATTQTTTSDAKAVAKKHQLQLNIGYLTEWNLEDIFIDYMKVKGYPDDFRWSFIFNQGFWNAKQAEEKGYIDPISGDLKQVPPALREVHGPTLLFGIKELPAWYAGDWVLTWKGDASATISGKGIREISSEATSKGGRMVFSVSPDIKDRPRPRFRNITSPIGNLKLYRLRDEAKVNAGALWNPDFLNYIARDYDIVRTVVPQSMNDTPVRRWSEVATPADPHFMHRRPNLTPALRPRNGRYGIPYEYLFDLALNTDTSLWVHIPIQIGSPFNHHDAAGNVETIFANARENASAILNSPEWGKFAVEFVKRLEASGYPKNRPLYIELGNEVWNFAWPFTIATKYAHGVADGTSPGKDMRYGYGLLSGRMITAMEEALAGKGYNVTYIMASQTAAPPTTRSAYQGLQDYLARTDQTNLIQKTGLTLTTYHGGETAYKALVTPQAGESFRQAFEREIKTNGKGLQRALRDRYVNGGTDVPFGKTWVLQKWKEHETYAREFGVRIIGAYEGGSHDNPPKELSDSEIFNAWWIDYHWGEEGADVVRQINNAVLDAYPGIILSNFASMGSIGDERLPWIDGHYANETAMSRMWHEFGRQRRSAQK